MSEAKQKNVCYGCQHYMEWTTTTTASDIDNVNMQCLKGAAYIDQYNIVTKCNQREEI
jgi:hypothetical protein